MTQPEALRLVGMLFGYFPSAKELSKETVALWANDLLAYEVVDGMEAAHTFGTMNRYPPSLADYIEGIKDERQHRLAQTPALLSHEGSLQMAAHPADDLGTGPGYAIGGALTIEQFLRSRPDIAARVKRLGWWGTTLEKIEGTAEALGR